MFFFSNVVALEFSLLSFICIAMCVLGCVQSSNKGLRHCSSEHKNMYVSTYCVAGVWDYAIITLYLYGFFLK